MPNKQQRNGFYYYMQDLMPQLKREGHAFTGGMKDVVPLAHPKWKALSQEERERYEARAREQKAKNRGSTGEKFLMDNTRTLLSERRDHASEMRNLVKEQRRYRQVMLNWRIGPSMMLEKFYLMDFTSMCKLEDTEYYIPIEMTVVEYSMKDGIGRVLHKFINPGDIPLGYRFECQNKSDLFHQIPIEGFNQASSDYLNIWHSLENFVCADGQTSQRDFPPFYCTENKMEEVSGCLLWLLHQSRVGRSSRFRIFHLESMVQDLFTYAEQNPPPSEVTIYDMLITSAFDYQKDVVCNYHNDLDCKNCCQGRVKIYCFAISDAMAPLYHFTPTARHLPQKSDYVGALVEPKPCNLDDRNLRQQVNHNYRGKGRGFMAQPRSQNLPPAGRGRNEFTAADVRLKESERSVVHEVEEDEFLSAAPSLRNPSRDAAKPLTEPPRVISGVPSSAPKPHAEPPRVISGVPSSAPKPHAEPPRVIGGVPSSAPKPLIEPPRVISGVPIISAPKRIIIGGVPEYPAPEPSDAPWRKPEPEPKSFDDNYPTLGGSAGITRSVGRGLITAKEINMGRGMLTWGLTQPGNTSSNQIILGAGRGRGGFLSPSSQAMVRPPPGILSTKPNL